MEMGKPLAFFKGVFEFFQALRHGKNFPRKFKAINRARRATLAAKIAKRFATRRNGRENIFAEG
jgi:hypothetical protein